MTLAATDGKTHTQMLKLVRYADVAATKRDTAMREAHRVCASLQDLAETRDVPASPRHGAR
jgi:hypothetical protein